jgi:hypothetical protein
LAETVILSLYREDFFMGFLPVLLNMDHIPVLVVGAGTVGHRKIAKLLDRDASVKVVIMPGVDI